MKLQITVLTLVNLIAFAALLYMFDVFGVVNYYTLMRSRIEPNLPGFVTRFVQKPRIEDATLLARDDLEAMRQSFLLREKDLEAQEQLVASRLIVLNTQEETLQADRDNLLAAWENYQNAMEERANYALVLSDMAGKVGSMPPNASVALLNQLASDGSDELVIDVLLEMDAVAEREGRSSITSYLLSLMDPTVSARLLSKYEGRTTPAPLSIPQSNNDFPEVTFDQ